MEYKAFDAVVLLPDSSGNYTVLNLYSGFPFLNGNCERVRAVPLWDKCFLENEGTFYKKNLFPSKIPNNFRNYVIKATTDGIHQFVSLISRKREEDSNTVYDIRGLMFEYFFCP